MEKIENKIIGLVYKNIDELIEFQGNLKELAVCDFEKLKNSFLLNGNISPIYIWGNKILDGHQRIKTLAKLREDGVDVPEDLPCVEIRAKSEKEAKKYILQYISQHGKITSDGLYEFISVNELDFRDLKQEINLPNFNTNFFEKTHYQDLFDTEDVPGDEDKNEKKEHDGFECPKCGYKGEMTG